MTICFLYCIIFCLSSSRRIILGTIQKSRIFSDHDLIEIKQNIVCRLQDRHIFWSKHYYCNTIVLLMTIVIYNFIFAITTRSDELEEEKKLDHWFISWSVYLISFIVWKLFYPGDNKPVFVSNFLLFDILGGNEIDYTWVMF